MRPIIIIIAPNGFQLLIYMKRQHTSHSPVPLCPLCMTDAVDSAVCNRVRTLKEEWMRTRCCNYVLWPLAVAHQIIHYGQSLKINRSKMDAGISWNRFIIRLYRGCFSDELFWVELYLYVTVVRQNSEGHRLKQLIWCRDASYNEMLQ